MMKTISLAVFTGSLLCSVSAFSGEVPSNFSAIADIDLSKEQVINDNNLKDVRGKLQRLGLGSLGMLRRSLIDTANGKPVVGYKTDEKGNVEFLYEHDANGNLQSIPHIETKPNGQVIIHNVYRSIYRF